MIKNNEAVVQNVVNQMKILANGSFSFKGFVIMDDITGHAELLKKLVEMAELDVLLVNGSSDVDALGKALNFAEENKYGLLSSLSRERYLVTRDYNSRIENTKDIYPFADLYQSEIRQLAEHLNVVIKEPKEEEYEEVESLIRLTERFYGQADFNAFIRVKAIITGTPIDVPGVADKLQKYGENIAATNSKMTKNLFYVKLRDNAELVS